MGNFTLMSCESRTIPAQGGAFPSGVSANYPIRDVTRNNFSNIEENFPEYIDYLIVPGGTRSMKFQEADWDAPLIQHMKNLSDTYGVKYVISLNANLDVSTTNNILTILTSQEIPIAALRVGNEMFLKKFVDADTSLEEVTARTANPNPPSGTTTPEEAVESMANHYLTLYQEYVDALSSYNIPFMGLLAFQGSNLGPMVNNWRSIWDSVVLPYFDARQDHVCIHAYSRIINSGPELFDIQAYTDQIPSELRLWFTEFGFDQEEWARYSTSQQLYDDPYGDMETIMNRMLDSVDGNDVVGIQVLFNGLQNALIDANGETELGILYRSLMA